MKLLLLFVSFGILLNSSAQGWMPNGSRSGGLGHASVAITDIWAFHHNPGALGYLTEGGVGVSYNNRFLLKELQQQSITFAQPLKMGVISVGAQTYGQTQFRTNRIGAGYALVLADKISAGVQMNYMNLRLNSDYGTKHQFSAEFGLLAKLSDELSLGFAVINLNRAGLSTSTYADDRFSTFFRLGGNYKISEKLNFLLEVEKEVESDMRLKGGIEYQPVENFYLRFGANGGPVELSLGFGYQWNKLSLDINTFWHQTLGWTPGASINYNFGKK